LTLSGLFFSTLGTLGVIVVIQRFGLPASAEFTVVEDLNSMEKVANSPTPFGVEYAWRFL
jgi:hypothetical protein